ncbi:unnamed protein product [Moneuplotes crassus]|uniref:Uncharacterized protein n=1 Tax=Euplotes crassus TaxID=5936 RepID=A0AAD1Y8F4_EUPCR|nr:unnamed protein product [Moneuplotes crassus]
MKQLRNPYWNPHQIESKPLEVVIFGKEGMRTLKYCHCSSGCRQAYWVPFETIYDANASILN